MLKILRDLLGGDDNVLETTLAPEPKLVMNPVRVLSQGKAIELALGKQALRLYPDIPLAADAKVDATDWILVDPDRFFSGIAGFARLEDSQTVLVGRDNELLTKIFDFPKSVMRRHLALTNDGGEIIIRPLDSNGKTYVSSIAENEDTDWIAARRVKNLKRLRTIYGGPIELLGPEQAMTALEQFRDILVNEAYRPKDPKNRPGGLLELPEALTPIIVGDIHAQLDNLLKILSLDGYLEGLERGDAYLLFLGDAVHREGDGELEEMDSSLLTLDLLFKLKARFPKNVFYLRGNHESFESEVGKGGVPQGQLLWQHSRALRGKKYAKLLAECFDLLPYLAKSKDFVACHAGPPRHKTSLQQLIGIHDDPRLARELVWNRMRRTGRPDGYAKRDVKALRMAVGAKKNTPFVISHTPLSRTDAIWTDAGEIPGHHIMYSANPNKLAVFIRSGREMIPLEHPGEPLMEFINALKVD